MQTDSEEFRQRLLRAFPPAPFYGTISSHDECDEGVALRQELPGKKWNEIPATFLDLNSGSLALFEQDALVAFLPAWLLRSVETMGGQWDSTLAEFMMYFLCPGSEDEGWDDKRIAELVALFNADQRGVVEDFLRMIAENDALPLWHARTAFGLKWWRSGGKLEPD